MKENVMKKFLVLILAMLLCFALFACSSVEPITYNYADSKFVGVYGANVGGEFKTYPLGLYIKDDGTGYYNYHAVSDDEDDYIYNFTWHPNEDGNGIALDGEITYYDGNLPKYKTKHTGNCFLYENDTVISILGDRLGRIE